nr:hypothetical protein HK105_000445 [Polyrhizophydium stewartii]
MRGERPPRCPLGADRSTPPPRHGPTTINRGRPLRRPASSIVKHVFGASNSDYACLFTDILPRRFVEQLVTLLKVNSDSETALPIVFVSSTEDPTNINAWMRAGAYVVPINTTSTGVISVRELQAKLQTYQSSILVIGFFPAVCEATGVLQPVADIARTLHRANRLVFFDYSTAVPFVDARLSATIDPATCPDGIITSTHNLLGGPNARSFLLIRKNLVLPTAPNDVSDAPREFSLTSFDTGSKPDVIGNVRAGFACLVKSMIGASTIQRRQLEISSTFISRFREHKQIILLGADFPNRLPIFSFIIKDPEGKKLLHHRFIARILNDIFGIQAWSGSSAAADYYFGLMNIGIAHGSKQIICLAQQNPRHPDEPIVISNNAPLVDRIVPGYVRIDLSFVQSHEELVYILDAVDWIAREGYTLLPLYEPVRHGTHWELSKTLPLRPLQMPLRPHQRRRRMDVKKYVSIAEFCIGKHWETTRFDQVASMSKPPEDALLYGRASIESDGSLSYLPLDGVPRIDPWYLTKNDVHDYLVRSGKLNVRFTHQSIFHRARWGLGFSSKRSSMMG